MTDRDNDSHTEADDAEGAELRNWTTALERARCAQARINTHAADFEERLVAVRVMLPVGARRLARDLDISKTAAEDLLRRAKGRPRRTCRTPAPPAPGEAGLEPPIRD